MSKVFVGREYYLEKFDEFLISESFEINSRVLLLQGDEGMGKTALLQAMAQRAAKQGHILAFGNLYLEQSDFFGQIYPLIAQIKLKQKLKIGDKSDWLKAGLISFAIATGVMVSSSIATLFSGVSALATLEIDIRKEHEKAGPNNRNFAEIFLKELFLRAEKMIGSDRIIIFLDPEKLTPIDIIALLKQLVERLPSRVRFVIAQRNNDCLIEAYKRGDLKNVTQKPLILEFLKPEEENDFINICDPRKRLTQAIRKMVLAKYEGWPQILTLAIEELLKIKRTISENDVSELPFDIDNFWKQRYEAISDENTLKLIHIVCLLSHPYPLNKLAGFMRLNHSTMVAIQHNSKLWDLFTRVDYKDILSPEIFEGCPYPKHITAKDYIRERLNKYPDLKNQIVEQIITHFRFLIGDDLSRNYIDKDALINILPCLLDNMRTNDFLKELDRLYSLKLRYGLLDSCLKNNQVAINICKKRNLQGGIAQQYGNIGIIHKIRGDLDQALKMHSKSLEIFKQLGYEEGMANQYGNMGNVYDTLGDFDMALEMYDKSLKLGKKLDRKESISANFGNMGNVYKTRGNIDMAFEMYNKSLEINKELGNKEGMANQYRNIGIIHKIRGDLDQALEMYDVSLEFYKELGNKEGMAANYGNRGNVFKTRGDLDQALEMYDVSLELYKELGNKEGIANQYGNRGNVFKTRGDTDQAFDMFKMSLKLNEEIGNKKGMANQYGNMGIVYSIIGKLDQALEMIGKSFEINKELDRKRGMAMDYYNMGSLCKASGDLVNTKEYWINSLNLFSEIRAETEIKKIESLLRDLNEPK